MRTTTTRKRKTTTTSTTPAVFSDEDSEAAFMDGVDGEIWEEDESGEWRARRDWSRFTAAKRIPVEDGLELRSRRGAIGESWWSRRFLSAVESILSGGRLTRGRTYARQGQVIDLGIGAGLVVAQVQGSRRTPYGVQISMPAASDARWDAIVDALAGASRLRGPPAGRRVAPRDRGRLRRGRGGPVPRARLTPDHQLHLPRLGHAVQARRRGVLPHGRGLRRRSLLAARLPGTRARGVAGRIARPPRPGRR